mgnify:CR=1 FL=1|tara:strand:+ start:128 stop:490 length:363 start_codon:yes stop_codon:yes gene_type:complete
MKTPKYDDVVCCGFYRILQTIENHENIPWTEEKAKANLIWELTWHLHEALYENNPFDEKEQPIEYEWWFNKCGYSEKESINRYDKHGTRIRSMADERYRHACMNQEMEAKIKTVRGKSHD